MTDYGKIKSEHSGNTPPRLKISQATAVRLGAAMDAPENNPPPHISAEYNNTITSEPQALDAIANGGRFIIIGNAHGSRDNQQAQIDLMSTFQRSHVAVIGIEMPEALDHYFKSLQTQIRKALNAHVDEHKLIQYATNAINKMMNDIHLVFTGGDELGPESLATLCCEATRHNIEIAAFDPRWSDPDWVAKNETIKKQIKHALKNNDNDELMRASFKLYSHNLSLDHKTAANAHAVLANKPPESRMVLLYGEDHISELTGPQPESRWVLSDYLKRYGSVTTISTDQPNKFPNRKYYVDSSLHFDASLRAMRDNQPPPIKILSQGTLFQPSTPTKP